MDIKGALRIYFARIRADLDEPKVSGSGALLVVSFIGVICWLGYIAPSLEHIHEMWGYAVTILVTAVLIIIGWAPIVYRQARPWLLERWDWLYDNAAWATELLRLAAWLPRKIVLVLQYLVAIPEIFLVRVIANLAGACIHWIAVRYAVLGVTLGGSVWAAWEAPQPWALVGLLSGFLIVFAIVRRWQWIESDRQVFISNHESHHFRILVPDGRTQDLRDEALTAMTALFILLPLGLRQLQSAVGWFEAPIGAPVLAWAGFLGGELAKAVPFVDWAEVYGVTNASTIAAKETLALHTIFAVRALFDLLLIASVVQGAQIMGRLSEQRKLLRKGELTLVDPFLEREEFIRADDEGELKTLDRYDERRLRRILEKHWDWETRGAAAGIAGIHRNKETFTALLVSVLVNKDETSYPRSCAANSLGKIGDREAVEPLIAVLTGASTPLSVRRSAVDALGRIGDPRAVEALVAAALKNDKFGSLRSSAASALGQIGDPRAVDHLITVLNEDKLTSVRRSAASALGQIGDPRAVSHLVAILRDSKLARMHSAAASALGQIGDPGAVDDLIALLAKGRLTSIRRSAARALGQIGDPRAEGALERAAQHDNDEVVRRLAAEALMRIRSGRMQAAAIDGGDVRQTAFHGHWPTGDSHGDGRPRRETEFRPPKWRARWIPWWPSPR